jgi:hypothetical protein
LQKSLFPGGKLHHLKKVHTGRRPLRQEAAKRRLENDARKTSPDTRPVRPKPPQEKLQLFKFCALEVGSCTTYLARHKGRRAERTSKPLSVELQISAEIGSHRDEWRRGDDWDSKWVHRFDWADESGLSDS